MITARLNQFEFKFERDQQITPRAEKPKDLSKSEPVVKWNVGLYAFDTYRVRGSKIDAMYPSLRGLKTSQTAYDGLQERHRKNEKGRCESERTKGTGMRVEILQRTKKA